MLLRMHPGPDAKSTSAPLHSLPHAGGVETPFSSTLTTLVSLWFSGTRNYILVQQLPHCLELSGSCTPVDSSPLPAAVFPSNLEQF